MLLKASGWEKRKRRSDKSRYISIPPERSNVGNTDGSWWPLMESEGLQRRERGFPSRSGASLSAAVSFCRSHVISIRREPLGYFIIFRLPPPVLLPHFPRVLERILARRGIIPPTSRARRCQDLGRTRSLAREDPGDPISSTRLARSSDTPRVLGRVIGLAAPYFKVSRSRRAGNFKCLAGEWFPGFPDP